MGRRPGGVIQVNGGVQALGQVIQDLSQSPISPLNLLYFLFCTPTVSEIKLFDYAPVGCTPSETVYPGTSPCTLLICSNDKWLKKCAHSGCTSLKIVHPALKMCTPGAGCMLNFGHCPRIFIGKEMSVGIFFHRV